GRQRRHPQGVLTGDDAVAVDLDPGKGAWFRSGRQDDVTGGQDGVVHLDADPRLGRDQPATAGHHLDAAGGDEPGEPLVQSVDDPVRVVPYPGRIDVVQVGVHPEGRAVTDGIGDLGGVQVCLGGDAAAVQAGAADQV